MINKKHLEQIQWDCIHFAKSGEIDSSEDHISIEIVEEETKETLLDKLSEALSFPDYFGNNWDATNDCLRDLSWLEKDGYTLIVKNASVLLSKKQVLAGELISAWLSAAEYWSKEGKPFHMVLILDESLSG